MPLYTYRVADAAGATEVEAFADSPAGAEAQIEASGRTIIERVYNKPAGAIFKFCEFTDPGFRLVLCHPYSWDIR